MNFQIWIQFQQNIYALSGLITNNEAKTNVGRATLYSVLWDTGAVPHACIRSARSRMHLSAQQKRYHHHKWTESIANGFEPYLCWWWESLKLYVKILWSQQMIFEDEIRLRCNKALLSWSNIAGPARLTRIHGFKGSCSR